MRSGEPVDSWKVVPLASPAVTVYQAPESGGLSVGHPSLNLLSGGRIMVSVEVSGPAVKDLPGKKHKDPHTGHWSQTLVLLSQGQETSWTCSDQLPISRACLFRDGHTHYLVGDSGMLQISRSLDGGMTWSKPSEIRAPAALAAGSLLGPLDACFARDRVHLPCMAVTQPGARAAAPDRLVVVVLSGQLGTNLTSGRSWIFSQPSPAFGDLVPAEKLDFFGIPFLPVGQPGKHETADAARGGYRPGWQRAQLVQMGDPQHCWHDPNGRTLHILAPASVHRSNFAALAKVVENPGGDRTFSLETTPAGAVCALLPLPGGHLDFHLVYDEPSALYWLASNQAREGFRRADARSRPHQGTPEEQHRLQLHFSRNLVDWCFAGFLDAGANPKESRCQCRLAIRGDALYALYCAGDAHARAAHFPNQLRLSVIRNFRELVY